MQWKQHRILYVKIVYKHNMTQGNFHIRGRGAGSLIKKRSAKVVEKCRGL
jgi:hypothetical protein